MILLNEEAGEVCAILDGPCLTRIRAGAVSGAATDLLSRKESKIFALIGTGGQAEAQLGAVLTVRNICEVRIFDSNKDRAAEFARKMAEKFAGRFNTGFFPFDSPDEAVRGADIITCVTTSKRPVFNGRLVKKGAHINGVGSYAPDMQEIDEYALLHADKIYVDTRDGVLNESGDFIIPIKENKFSEKDITGELGELILGKVPGRESEEEITLFKSVGSGVLDIVTARRIYEKAIEKGIDQIIEF